MQFSAQQIYVITDLILAEIDIKILAAYMNNEKHAEIVQEFNTDSNKSMILMISYTLNSSDFNLQNLCQNVYFFKISMNKIVAVQIINCC